MISKAFKKEKVCVVRLSKMIGTWGEMTKTWIDINKDFGWDAWGKRTCYGAT